MLAVRGRSPLIDQTIHTVYLAPLNLMTVFFGFFSPALTRKDDQFQPEPEKIVAGLRHTAQREELRLPVQARVMMNRRFGEMVTGPAQLIDHLSADDAARRGQRNALNGLASHQTEIAIHVADRQSEHPSRQKFVYRSQHDSVASTPPHHFIGGIEIYLDNDHLVELRHRAYGYLAVAIGVQ